jgi:hypothetical protein
MSVFSPHERLNETIIKDTELDKAQDLVQTELDLAVWEWLDAENQHKMQEAAIDIARLGVARPEEDSVNKEKVTPPKGFTNVKHRKNGAVIDLSDVRNKIHSLALSENEEFLTADSVEYISDSGKTVRVTDLRPYMTSQVQKGGPRSGADAKKLDDKFFEELKNFTDEGGMIRNPVEIAHGVGYAKVGGTKMRAYFMPINDEKTPDGTLAVARIADCSDSISSQGALYRRVFKSFVKN